MKLFNKIAIAALGASMAMGVGIGILAHNRQYMGANAAGVYEKYSGALTAGNYIITYDNAAMKAAISSDRLQYDTVTATDNKITGPADNLVWTLAQSGDYWTIYSASASKYAASTGAKNKAQLLASGIDDKSLWTVSGTSTYEFVNKQNTTNGVNANLRRNGTYGFACYASGTGGALTLYKYTGEASGVAPESISCSAQSIDVAKNVDLSKIVTFTPNSTTEKGLSFAIKSGSEFIDLTEAGVVTGKKGGAAVVTITPDDTTGGATAIDVNVTVNSIAAPGITIGEQYAMYAIDEGNSYQGELSGVASSLGTVASFTGEIPSCDYLLSVEEGYYENTVALKLGTSYLALTSNDNNLRTVNSIGKNASWIVTWDSGTNAAVIQNAVYSTRTIQFNYASGNPRFACYASEQVAVCLYHYVEKALVNFTIEEEINVYKSGTATIQVTYEPADAADKALLWESDNEDIATVDDHGVVTGVAIGTTTITASKTIAGNPVERTCTVHVLNNQAAHDGTQADPFNVDDAVNVTKGVFTKNKSGADIDLANEYYVSGMITKNNDRTTSTLTFWIGDSADQISAATGGFEIFKAGKVYGTELGTRYTDNTQVQNDFVVGDTVVVKGTFVYYNSVTPETSQGTADVISSSRIELLTPVRTFVTNNMHMGEEAYSGNVGPEDGACRDADNFVTVVTAFNSLSAERRAAFLDGSNNEFKNARNRLNAWALANQYHLDADNMYVEDTEGSSILMNNDANPFLVTMLIISSVALAGFTALIIVKKKKHQ